MTTTQQITAFIATVDEERAEWLDLSGCQQTATSASFDLYRRWRDSVDRTNVVTKRIGGQTPRASGGPARSMYRETEDCNEPSR